MKPFPEKGKPKGERLADAASLQSIYQRFKLEDIYSSKQRMGIRAMIDGQPPYKEALLRKAGAANRTNLNFGEANARLQQTLTSYNDLIESVPVVIAPMLPRNVLDDASRTYAQDVIADEWTTMLRDWEDFDARWQVLSKEFVEHGVSLAFHPDDIDWKFDVVGWDQFQIPRGTRASEEFIDVLIIEKWELPSDLYEKIEDEAAAKEMGWNVDAVKQALVRATKFGKKPTPNNWGAAWAETQMHMKSNDLYVNHHDNNARCYTLHAYVREYDGTYSHYIVERDSSVNPGKSGQEFLYKNVASENSPQKFFTTFCLNVGDGLYHTIRGQGYQMFPFVQTSNKIRCTVLDNVMLSNRTILQPKDINSLDESPLTISGSVAIMSPDVDLVERDFVDHSRTTLPVLHDFAQMMEGVAPTQQSNGVPMGSQPTTKYGLQAQQSIGSSLTIGSVNMFYRGWRREIREMFRRTQNIIRLELWEDYPEVADFVQRCSILGVPPEIILAVDRVFEKRAIGAGSPGMRQAILDRGFQKLNTLDEVGRAQFLHDAWVADVGVRDAQRYMPVSAKPRPVLDQKIAELENSAMYGGKEVPPLGDENHAVHTAVHLPSIGESIQKLEAWRNGGEQGDIQQLQPEIAYLSLMLPHTEQHIEAMMSDPTRAQEAAAAKKALQEFGAMWMTYVRQLNKALEEQAAEANQAEVPDPVEIAKIAKIQQEMDISIRKFQMSQQLQVADVQNRLSLRKQQADLDAALKINKHNTELATELPPASQSDVMTNRTVRTPLV